MQNRKRNTPALVAGFAAIAGLSIATGAPALATAIPATGGPLTTEPPSVSPSTGAPVTETGIYLYKKLDLQKPAAWENSGDQSFLAKQPGHQWFTDISALVPAEICGPGWAVQQDVLEFKGTYDWPKTIRYPDFFPGNPTLKDDKHQELEDLMTVPDCEKPSPKPDPTDTPSDTPSEKPTPKPDPTDTPSDTPSEKVTPEPTPSSTPSTTPAAAMPPSGTDTTPPAAGNTDPRVSVAGNTDQRVPDAGLANTGAAGTWLAVAGAAVLALGTVLVVMARRRKA